LIATLLHPLYTVPLLGSFCCTLLFRWLRNGLTATRLLSLLTIYFLAVVPYTFFLWYTSRQETPSIYNASLIHEIIRAPHHLTIPTLVSPGTGYLFFYVAIAVFLAAHPFFSRFDLINNTDLPVHEREKRQDIYTIIGALIGFMLLASVISTLTRIDLLVQLTPYRTGLIVVMLSWLLFLDAFFRSCCWRNLPVSKGVKTGTLIFIFLFGMVVGGRIFIDCSRPMSSEPAKKEMIDWIQTNCSTNRGLFLNYSDIDVRTCCRRSDFFRFQTFSLSPDGQIDWYNRLLIYYDVQESIDYQDYEAVKKFIQEKKPVRIENVLKKIPKPVSYLLKQRNSPIILGRQKLLFSNELYELYGI